MSYSTEDLIRYRINRAHETIFEAQLMLDNSHLFAATNRCYYAVFYAVSALLLTKNLRSSKHSGILAFFIANFVKTGVISEDWGIFYKMIFRYRHKADYEDYTELNASDITEWLESAGKFVGIIDSIIQNQPKAES